jgi:hypothetical protein
MFILNYVGNILVLNATSSVRGGHMERIEVSHTMLLIASVTMGVSAVCSGVIATGLASGLSGLEGLMNFLGFHLNHLTPFSKLANYSFR